MRRDLHVSQSARPKALLTICSFCIVNLQPCRHYTPVIILCQDVNDMCHMDDTL